MVQKKKLMFGRNCNGATAVEFALIFPIFFLMVFSIIEFGMIMTVQSIISSSALEASRYGTTGSTYGKLGRDGKAITRKTLVENTINDKISALPFYDQAKHPVTIQLSSLGKIESPTSKTPITSAGGPDEVIEYKIIYTWDILSPIMYPILGMDGKFNISASTVIKNESF
jgi:hypothetical protein